MQATAEAGHIRAGERFNRALTQLSIALNRLGVRDLVSDQIHELMTAAMILQGEGARHADHAEAT